MKKLSDKHVLLYVKEPYSKEEEEEEELESVSAVEAPPIHP